MYPSTWNESTFQSYSSKKLKVGYYFDDGVTIASPPVYRAIMQTVQALKAQGHEVVLVSPPNIVEAVRVFVALTSDESYPIPNSLFSSLYVHTNTNAFVATPTYVSPSNAIQWNPLSVSS